jgi:hypothetical protein
MDRLENHGTRQAVRRDGWTAARRTGFLEALTASSNVQRACLAVRMSRQSAYRLRTRDPAFAAAWDDALRAARRKATEAFLSALPDFLLKTLSDSSTPCHLRQAQAHSASAPRSRSVRHIGISSQRDGC